MKDLAGRGAEAFRRIEVGQQERRRRQQLERTEEAFRRASPWIL